MSKVLYWLLFIMFLVICILSYIVNSNRQVKNELVLEIETLKQKKPVTVTVREVSVEYKYLDSKTITIEKVPEGYVKFDTAKYEAAIVKNDNLKTAVDSLKILQKDLAEKIQNDSTLSTSVIKVYKEELNRLDLKIKEMEKNIINPLPQNFTTIQNKGFIFKPMIAVGYDSRFDGFVGAKLAFWNKYGLITGTTRENFGIGVSRHLYDLLPPLKNTEIMILGGLPYKNEGSRIFVGIGVGL